MIYRRVVKNNPDISYLYILYQFWMMLGSVVGPGSIFLVKEAFKIEKKSVKFFTLWVLTPHPQECEN